MRHKKERRRKNKGRIKKIILLFCIFGGVLAIFSFKSSKNISNYIEPVLKNTGYALSFSGTTRENETFSIYSQKAQQSSENMVDLEGLSAFFDSKNGPIRIQSHNGRFNTESKEMLLRNNIQVFFSNDLFVSFEKLVVCMDPFGVWSQNPVYASFNKDHIVTADTFSLKEDHVILFKGRVRITLNNTGRAL